MSIEAFDSQAGGISTIATLTLSLDTSAYVDGDLMADVQELTDAVRPVMRTGIIQTLTVIDKDDNGGAFEVWITGDSTSWGTENDAIAVTDALAEDIQGRIVVGGGDYYDLGAVSVAHIRNLGIPIQAAANTTSVYVAAVARGANTYTASGIILKFGILVD